MRRWLGLLALVVPFLMAPTEDATFQLEVTSASTVTASITAHRTSGAAPLGVFFDGTGSSDTSLADSLEHRDLDYKWDFTDCLSGATYGPSGRSKEFAFLPQTARVFEAADFASLPGTCDVTLTVTNAAGDSDTATQTITVDDPDATYTGTLTRCIDADAVPSAGADGCPSGASTAQNSDFDAAVANALAAGATRILFRNGETYSQDTQVDLSTDTDGFLGTYGSGAKAAVTFSMEGTNDGFVSPHGGGSNDNWRVAGFDVTGPSAGDADFINVTGNTSHAVGTLIHDITITPGTVQALGMFRPQAAQDGNGHENIIVSELDAQDMGAFNAATTSIIAFDKGAIIGSRISTDPTGKSTIRLAHFDNLVIQGNKLGPQPGPTSALITMRSNDNDPADDGAFDCEGADPGCDCASDVGVFESSDRASVGQNTLIGFDEAVDAGIVPCKSAATVVVNDVRVEGNYIKIPSGNTDNVTTWMKFGSPRTAIRNNLFSMTESEPAGGGHRAIQSSEATTVVQNNTGWYTGPTAGTLRILNTLVSITECRNNVYVNTSGGAVSAITGSGCSTQVDNQALTSNPFTGTDPTAGAGQFVPANGSAIHNAGSVWSNGVRLRDHDGDPAPVSSHDVGGQERP